ncbi:MAG: hypothetical protein IJ379_09000 [Lachnospiraceae bacterium]|nr:hypothetical protein [Lachnospiraceae bacterium]MBQ7776047.1 hypothetical protein [Lachnospiraceae bacterium]
MFYDKKIKYLDVYEKGEKLQNAGFIKLEAREDTAAIQIRVEKLRTTDVGNVEVLLCGDGKEGVLGELLLERGRGVLECRNLPVSDLKEQIGYSQLEEIYLKLPGERVLRCVIQEKAAPEVVMMQEKAAPEVVMIQEKVVSESATVQEKAALEAAMIPEDGLIPEAIFEAVPQLSRGTKSVAASQEPVVSDEKGMVEGEPLSGQKSTFADESDAAQGILFQRELENVPESFAEMEAPSSFENPLQPGWEPMSEPKPILRPTPTPPRHTRPANFREATKWQQLSVIYPHIRPFQDGRDYLQLRPEDFVILTQKYYPLITNSFLLHGFYNYGHLILTKEKRQEGDRFYIGVPGNFYDKEKQIAVLYGFESFEGKTEPAREGDFGYYMIPVEI